MRIILASNSPRRKMLMNLITTNYEIIPSNYNEEKIENLTIEEQSKRLSYMKAKTVFDKTNGNRIVIGSDTMVIKDNMIYEKPSDIQEAKVILNKLKNSDNTVITSLSILTEINGKIEEYVDYDITRVFISDMTDQEIEEWINSGDALDKAGAYTVDAHSKFAKYINRIEGNYNAVIGLSVDKVYQYLKKYIRR